MLALLFAIVSDSLPPRLLCDITAKSEAQQIAYDMVTTRQVVRGCLPDERNRFRQVSRWSLDGRLYVLHVRVWDR